MPNRANDFNRRLVITLLAVATPFAAAQDSGDSDTDQDTDDTDRPTHEYCVPWAADVQGECPTGAEIDTSCADTPVDGAAPGIFADGSCCYVVVDACGPVGPIGCGCSHGRPLTLHREPIRADREASSEWFDPKQPAPEVSPLSARDRARLAHYWASIASAEHASIASFHRLGLELLSLRAPHALVLAASRAAMDEIKHARMAFTLASVFAGCPVGPSALPLSAAVPLAGSRLELLRATARDACAEETISACAAAEMLAGARDPAIRAVLEQIVRDEVRHAELAWRIARWVVDSEGADGLAALRAGLDDWKPSPGPDPWPPSPALRAWGCVGDDELAVLVGSARRQVVEPVALRMGA